MDFETAHHQFIEHHINGRAGERKGRLLRGHQYAEKLFLQNIWWPIFGNFNDLHPEYEIYDWNRKSQFLDFAYLPPGGRFGLECDGFQSHVKDMDREKFSYAVNRDTFLTGMGWKMIHFSFDDIAQRPEVCRSLLQLVMSPYLIYRSSPRPEAFMETELLKCAWRFGKAIRPKDVTDHFGIDFRTARNLLRALVDKGLFTPVSISGKIRYYELTQHSWEHLL